MILIFCLLAATFVSPQMQAQQATTPAVTPTVEQREKALVRSTPQGFRSRRS